MPDVEGSITLWIGGLKAGDEAAAQQLWERYFAWMMGLARDKLRAAHRGDMGSDEEDAAMSAFDGFSAGAARGQFPAPRRFASGPTPAPGWPRRWGLADDRRHRGRH
jgi:ECF sigma factor